MKLIISFWSVAAYVFILVFQKWCFLETFPLIKENMNRLFVYDLSQFIGIATDNEASINVCLYWGDAEKQV